jgi:hypothetical protein
MVVRFVRLSAVVVMFLISLGGFGSALQNQKSVPFGTAVFTKDSVAADAQNREKPEHWVFYVNFDKKKLFGPEGCLVHVQQGVHDAELLHCRITAPPEAKGYISRIDYSCEGSAVVCGYVHTCPEKCQDHVYNYEPHDLDLVKVRTVDWYGWTNSGDTATLRFDVFMRDEDKK